MQFAQRENQELKEDDQCKPVRNSLSNASPIVLSSLFNGYKSARCMYFLFYFFLLFSLVVYFTRRARGAAPLSYRSLLIPRLIILSSSLQIHLSFVTLREKRRTCRERKKEREREREREREGE